VPILAAAPPGPAGWCQPSAENHGSPLAEPNHRQQR
jgi:hypothetical protein